MPIITATTPPEIMGYFNSCLLSTPIEFRDSLKKLWEIYQYIKIKLIPKAKNDTIWMEKLAYLEKEFLELYERTQAKEKNIKAETKNKAQEPFYYIKLPHKGDQNIFDGLRFARFSTIINERGNDEG